MIAAKFGDPVLGIDFHMVMVPTPGGPVPTPLPHPFIGIVFDPLGAAMGAAMGAVFGGGGPVFVNGLPCGNTGTEVKNIPHVPTPPGVAPAPNDPPGNEGTLVTGSKTVNFGGSSESRTLSMVTSCNFPINLPTSVCGAVPMGAPVLIGGPEAVDFTAAVTQGIKTKWVSDKLHALAGATKGSKRSKFICFLTGHPVDVMTGELIADAVDAEFPGLIPLTFERNYRSRETESQLLGPGWYHFFDAYVEPTQTSTLLRLTDGRPAEHPKLSVGESYFHAPDRYTLTREYTHYSLTTIDGLRYIFSPTQQSAAAPRYRLSAILDRAGNEVRLEWSGPYLATITDTAGRKIEGRYSKEGKLERLVLIERRPDGIIEHVLAKYGYDDAGHLAEVKDPLGHAMRYAYTGGVLVKEVHKSGLTFHFEWDWLNPRGWCTRTWGDAGDSDGACMDLVPGARGPRAIFDRRITYNPNRHRTVVKDLRGGITYYEGNALEVVDKEIDATGRITTYEWNEHAWKTAEVVGDQERTEWTYDARGNQTSETNAEGRVTRREYDRLDRLTRLVLPNGAVYELEYDTSSRPSIVTRPDGTAFLYTYDHRGRLTKIDDPMGHVTRIAWNDDHTLRTQVDPEGRTTAYDFDGFGRLTSVSDPLGRTLLLERDLRGDEIYVMRPDGETYALKRDAEGNIIEQTDSRGRTTRMRYAGMNQLVEHTDPMGHRVRLRYDTEMDLVGVENQSGDLYTFDLDACGRVKEERTFSGTKRKFTFDKAGRVSRVWTGGYRVSSFERDKLGRVVKLTSQGGNPHALTKPFEETFAYDEAGELVAARTQGGDVTLERDLFGRVTREQETSRATALDVSISSRYDPAGVRVDRVSSMGQRADYQWNRAGELVGVKADWDAPDVLRRIGMKLAARGSFDVRLARDPLGQELARRLPGGVSSVWGRDTFGRAKEQRVVTGASSQAAGRDVAQRDYAWSSPEEIASITTASGTTKLASQYEYDPRGHLIREIFPTGEVLERQSDAAGNLFRTANRRDRTYGRGGVIQRSNGTIYEADADGFLVKKTLADGAAWRYVWDAHGHLTEAHRPDGKQVLFTYDAFGRRTTKTFDGKVTEFVWDGDDLIHERVRDSEGNEQPLTTWVFEPGTFTPLVKVEGKKRYGIITDHLGSPTMLATEAGKIAWKAQLDVYGVPREETPSGVDAATEDDRTKNPWRFPGQYEDEETGLYYNRYRYYDPELGRYLSEDPIGLRGQVAQYAYTQNPTVWIDPLGLKTSTNVLRTLWEDYTGSPAKNQIHHGLPEELADDFKKHGLDVNNPKYFYDLTPKEHIYRPGVHTNSNPFGKNWNAVWKDWLADNKAKLTAAKDGARDIIERRLRYMATRTGISHRRAKAGCK